MNILMLLTWSIFTLFTPNNSDAAPKPKANLILELDFGQNKTGGDWRVINDGVMGGLSEGSATLEKNNIHFKGRVSLENNGGFSSLKGAFLNYDLEAAKFVEIRYRASGHKVALTLENRERFYFPYYKLLLESTNGEWASVKIPIDQFKEYQIGRATGQSISKQYLSEVIRVGFITAEKEASTFDIAIDYVRFTK